MAWTYNQRTGQLKRNGTLVGTGYSGTGTGRNNPLYEGTRRLGPIPRGQYRIGASRNSARTGPHIMDLTPVGHNAQGRTAFEIHGDNSTHNASEGCIILPRAVRDRIAASGDTTLEVN